MFWGALAAGAVPVPPAAQPRRIEPVWELLGRPPVMVDEVTSAVAVDTGDGPHSRPNDTVRLLRLDLSCVRLLLVGAEPISPRVWREFTARAAPAGLDARAPLPVNGLAEATLAVTVPPLGETASPLVLDRAALSRGRAVETDPGPHSVE
ncbi:hypothetical protein [Streptomyces sp. Root264]|uniref:hypothetical protein n=1 Tax=Streptomyces sp. Root264 TaxID=1736503 RepID=UPI00070D2781|nr:hypothetical protein ASE41_31495 [Streptomyces sp. Root264]